MKYKAIRTETEVVTLEDARHGEDKSLSTSSSCATIPSGFFPPLKDKFHKGSKT